MPCHRKRSVSTAFASEPDCLGTLRRVWPTRAKTRTSGYGKPIGGIEDASVKLEEASQSYQGHRESSETSLNMTPADESLSKTGAAQIGILLQFFPAYCYLRESARSPNFA